MYNNIQKTATFFGFSSRCNLYSGSRECMKKYCNMQESQQPDRNQSTPASFRPIIISPRQPTETNTHKQGQEELLRSLRLLSVWFACSFPFGFSLRRD